MGPCVRPVGDGGDTGGAECPGAEHRNQRDVIVDGDLTVAEIADPQVVGLRPYLDDSDSLSFQFADGGVAGVGAAFGLSVCGRSDHESEVAVAGLAQAL
jgi:hypothetical protein